MVTSMNGVAVLVACLCMAQTESRAVPPETSSAPAMPETLVYALDGNSHVPEYGVASHHPLSGTAPHTSDDTRCRCRVHPQAPSACAWWRS